MLPLRYSRGWRIAGVVVLILVLAGTLLPAFGFWTSVSIRGLIQFDKWLHAGAFLFLAVWFSGQYARQSYWRIALGLLLFGATIELIQLVLAYRSGDFADMLANVAGIVAGLGIAFAGAGGWSVRVERWLDSEPVRES